MCFRGGYRASVKADEDGDIDDEGDGIAAGRVRVHVIGRVG